MHLSLVWQFFMQASVLATAMGVLWLYRRRRPTALVLYDSTEMACGLADGKILFVRSVRYGLVTPALICAVLVTSDGRARQLFIPGCSVTDRQHWMLRRALLAWREADDARADPDQSASRRGT
jgi:hypothetical protein